MAGRAAIAHHAHLMDTMAETIGLDLEEQLLRGHLTPDDVVDAVLACTGCTSPGACQKWLARMDGNADVPPSYCRNTGLFEEIRSRG